MKSRVVIYGKTDEKALDIYTYTAPKESPASINDGQDLEDSTAVVMANLTSDPTDLINEYDGIIVACFSVHPLVSRLSSHFQGRVVVTGIFEASILTSLSLLSPYPTTEGSSAWGIVTTGKYWETHLSDGVKTFLGQDPSSSSTKFAGVFSTGLNAGDFHGDIPAEVIKGKLEDAARKLLTITSVGCVVMGCAGMAGLEEIIRETAVKEYGEERGNRVCIVDGVKAGVVLLNQTIKARAMFQNS